MAEPRRLSHAARQFGAALTSTVRTLLPAVAALLLWQGEAKATHAMGGELTYECIGNGLYRVRLNFYRDCNGVAAPTNCSNGREFRLVSPTCNATVNACFGLDGVDLVTPICVSATDRCNSSSGQYGIQRYRYSAVVNLSSYTNCGADWTISWDLCCRNNAITSLNNPGNRNLYLTATLNNTIAPCNNSPRYLNTPTPFACVGQAVSYNHGFNDVDGDSLSFELAPALGANGATIPYNAGYSFTQPVITAGGANAVQVNPVTGTINFVPSIQQFAVVTVRVREWRNGVQIGSYLRDVQFAIIACSNNLPTVSGVNGTNAYTTTICAGEQLCFNVNSGDADAGQTVTMTWNNGIPGATFSTTAGSLPVGTFCWTPTAADIGQNLFSVNVVDDACPQTGVNNFGFSIQVTPPFTPANAGPDQSVCGFSTPLAGLLPFPQVQGTWTVVSGTGTFANANNPTTTVSGLSTGPNVFRWTVNYGTCGTTSDDVTVNAFNPAQPVANAGPDQNLCGAPGNGTNATLAANVAVTPAVGTWTVVTGSGTFANANSPTTAVSGLGIGANTFRWTIVNGACDPPTSDQVTVFVFSNAQPAANAGPDQQLCQPTTSATLAGNAVTFPATGLWTVVSGTGTFANASQRNTTVSGLSVGVNTFRWTINNGPCTPPTTQDEVSITVFNPASPNANAGADQQVCAANSTLGGNAPLAPATGQWTLVSGAGTITTPTSPSSTVTGLGFGTNVFQWTLNNGPCANGVTTDQVTIVRFDPNTPAATAGPDQDLCLLGASTTTVMAANAAVFPATGLWTVVSGTATLSTPTSPTTTVTNLTTGTVVLRWTISNGPCTPQTTSDDVTLRIFNGAAPAANAGPDQDRCAPVASVTLAANAATAPATGTWTVVSGTGTFANANSPTTTVSGMGIGSNVYRWTINNGPCAGAITSDDVLIRLFDPATATANAGPDQQLCGSTGSNLAGSAVNAPAVGTWTLVSGAGAIVDPNNPGASVTGLGIGANVFRWTVNNGPCGTSNDEVTILRFDPDNASANAGPDQSICVPTAPNLVTLAGSAVTFPATGTWTVVSGGGTFADASSPTTTVSAMPIGINEFRWTVSNGPCPNGVTNDVVRVLVFSNANPVANAGPDVSLCSASGTITMAGSSLIVPATGQWTLVSGTGTITNPASPTTTVTGIGVGQSIFQWTVSNGPCSAVTTDQMSVFVYDPNNPAANAGADQSFCTPLTSTTLAGSAVAFPATGVWSIVSGSGTFTNANDPNTTVTALGLGTNQFAWTVNNGVCPNAVTTDVVQVELFNGNAQAADAGPDQSVCGTSSTVVMSATAATGLATGSWSVVQGTATFSNIASPTATVSGLSIGINVLRWSINNGACGITTDQVTILVYDPNNPVANAGPDQELCTPNTSTTLTGSALMVPAVGTWSLVSGSGTLANPTAPTTAVSGLALGANVFRWQVNNGACPSPITQDEVTIFVFELDAPAANAGPDQEICTPVTSVSMAANSPVASALGTWTLVSGGGTITNVNNPNTTITALPVGINVFEWTIDNGPCGTTSDVVRILVFDANNPVADAGADQELCTPASTATLTGSALTVPATGLWTLVSGTGVITDPTAVSTTVTGLGVGENIFQWTVSNGPCVNGITSDQVIIRVFDDANAVADAGADQEFCTPVSTTTVNGSPVIFPAQGRWEVVSGSAVITSPNSPTTTVTGLGVGETVLRYIVANGPCSNPETEDLVSIFIFDANNAAADAGADQELCTPNTSTAFQGSAVTFPASGLWTLVSGGGTITDPTSPTSTVTGLPVGENVFQWSVANGPCANGNTTDQVTIRVFDETNPVAAAGADQELCTPNTIITLTGSSIIFPATGTWTLVNGAGTITSPNSPTTTVTDLGVGENIFEWTVSNGPCANGLTTDRVSIFVFDQGNNSANAGPDQQLCSPVASVSMAGSSVTFPAQGTWTLITGSGTIVAPNSPTTAILNPGVGENIFQWSVDNGPCESGAGVDQVSIFVFDVDNAVADAGADQEHCSPNIFTTQLTGSPVTFPAVGTWTLVSGTGTIANPNDPNTAVFDIAIGESVFLWTVDNGPCASGITTDEVRVRIFDENNPNADAGADQDLCTPVTSAVLTGSAVTFPALGTWAVVSGSGVITDVNNPNTTITGMTPGVTVVAWTVSNGPCANGITSDQLVITLYDQNNPLANAGADQELCTPTGTTTNTTLQGSSIIFPAQGTWTLVGGTGNITDPNDPNTAVDGLSIGENLFLWTVTNGVCNDPITTDLVSVFVFDENNPDAVAGPSQQICTPVTNAFMAGSSITFPAVGTWTLVSGQGTIVDANDPLTEITDLGLGVNVFEWTVDNGACPNGITTDQVTLVLFDAQAPPADAGPDQELCAPDDSAVLVANPPVGAAFGTWTILQGSGSVADENNPNTTVSGMEVGETILTWTLSSGVCVTTVDSVSIFVFDPNNPIANAGLDQELCVPQDSVFMAGSNLIFPAQGTWTLVSGTGTPVAPNDPGTLISGLSVGQNVFQWEVYNGPCANSLTSDQVTITLFSDSTSAANAGPDLESCLPITTVTMQGEQPIAPGEGTWTLISGTGAIADPNDPNTQVSGLSQGENVLVWTLNWDPCPNNGLLTDTVTVRIYNAFAPAADAGPDQDLCSPTNTSVLAGNTPEIPGVGTWTVNSGTAVVTSPNNPTSEVTNLTVGVHELVWTIFNGTCGFGPPTTDTLFIRVYDNEAPPAQAGNDISWCTPQDNAVLSANDPVFPAVGTWTVLSGTGTIANPNDPNTAVFGLGVGQHDFLWTIDNGSCGSSSDAISVFIYDGESADANAGADQELCTPDTDADLQGNAAVFPATGLWTVTAGTGSFADATNPTSTVSGLSIGTNTFVWTITNGPCGTTSDEVTITVFDADQAPADAGADQQLCTPVSSTTLSGSAVSFPAVGTWEIINGTGTLSDPNAPNATLSGIGVGQVVLRWTVDNGPCATGNTSDEVTINIYDNTAPNALAGPDQAFCTPIGQPVTMLASSAPFPAIGTWNLVSGSGTITNVNNEFTSITGLGLGANLFQWTVDNGACGSTSDEVLIAVFDHTVPAADAGVDQEFCQDVTFTDLDAVPATSTASGTWTLIAGAGTIANAGDANTEVTGLLLGNNWFTWTITNGPCPSSTDSMVVFIRDCLTINIPNAYSPNGDGVNDVFRITNVDSYPQSSFQVFNRWGSKVLDQSPYANDWDGRNQFGSAFGELLPESTYYYILDLGDGSEAYTGYIYLRR